MVKIDGLQKKYKDFELNVSMEIPKGTITGIIGKNGAGKSTTIKSILGLVKPDAGSVCVFGKDALLLDENDKAQIGVALSDSGFSMLLNVKHIAAILKKFYSGFDEEFYYKKCNEMGLPMEKNLKDYSTGMKAKLRVLVAMSHPSKLLVLDEPTAGLDIEARTDILDLLREYMEADENRAILISSHISSDLEGLCDDIYLIHDGRIILHEDLDTILSHYALLKLNEEAYEKLDKSFILKSKKVSYGYTCLTNQKQFYKENYPDVVVENGNIDELILMMTGGK